MGIKLESNCYYKLSDGRVVGPAEVWDEDMEHPFQLPVKSDEFPNDEYTLFRRDGTTDYASFHVVERVAKPAFVEAGAYYKTAGGMTVGPMVGPDAYGRFTSAGNELYAIRNDGVALASPQQWEGSGVVLAECQHEKGHLLVERVAEPAKDTGEVAGSAKTEMVLKIDMSEASFLKAFNATTTEFVNRLNEAQAEIANRDAEIARLTAACQHYQKSRDEWFDAWSRTSEMKDRGDKRLRLARSRYKVARGNFDIVKVDNDGLRLRIAELEKGERSKKVKAVVDFIGGLFVLGAVAVATYLVAVA